MHSTQGRPWEANGKRDEYFYGVARPVLQGAAIVWKPLVDALLTTDEVLYMECLGSTMDQPPKEALPRSAHPLEKALRTQAQRNSGGERA